MKTKTSTLKINHAFSAAYHPQTNSEVERFNTTSCTQLAKYYDENSNDWNEYLEAVIFAYNTGVHATTGYILYELAFARKQRSPSNPILKRITRK
jgi:transposase InsO family protein